MQKGEDRAKSLEIVMMSEAHFLDKKVDGQTSRQDAERYDSGDHRQFLYPV
jgi:hypothetical protein